MGSGISVDLGDQIRSTLLRDPRAQTLAPDQLNQLVSTLSGQAQKEGITAGELAYRPGSSYVQPIDGYVSSPNYTMQIVVAAGVVLAVLVLSAALIVRARAAKRVPLT